MLAHGEGRACRGSSGKPGTCCAPGGCTMQFWIVCREEQPQRARDAVRALAREQAAEWVYDGLEDETANAIAEVALGLTTAELTRKPLDRTVETMVGDLLWEVLGGSGGQRPLARWRHDGRARPSPPEGWTWQKLLDAFHVALANWARQHGIRGSVAADLAQAALTRLYVERLRGVEIRHPLGWARCVFASLVRDAARGKASGPLLPRIGSRETVARDLAALRVARSPEDEAAHRELVERAPALLHRLPPPYREIAHLQYLLERSRREIGAWLRTWRPIKDEGIRTLFLRAHQMLKAIGDRKDPRTLWPGRYAPEKNPWFSCPPPPLLSPL